MIEIEVKIERLVWSSTQNDFKIYGAIPVNESDIEEHGLKFNQYNNLTLNGVLPRLNEGVAYQAKLKEKNHPKYGISYEVISIHQDVPTSASEQKAYLKTILTESQVNNIYDVYNEETDIINLFQDNTFDYNSVKGMGEHMYNIVRSKIISNLELQEALVALSKYGLTYNIISKLVKKYGSAKLVVQKIEENPYTLTEVDGIGFIKCDTYALSMGVKHDSINRIEACVNYVLEDESEKNGHCWITISGLIKRCAELMEIGTEHIQKYIENCNDKKLYINEDKIAKVNSYNHEKWLGQAVKRLLAEKPKPIENLEERIIQAEQKQGFQFTDEQKDAIRLAVENNVIIITGKAGTGKTTILKGIIDVLKSSDDFKNYFTCALSGKASQRIEESTGLQSSTMHRLLGWNAETNGFHYNHENKLPKGVGVLDEGSMVNSYMFCSLASAMETGSKFIILGDTEQLEPIGSGTPLKDMIDSDFVPVAFLTQVHRQAMKSGILTTANEIREGIQINEKDNYEDQVLGELKDLYFHPYRRADSVKKQIIKSCKQYLKSPSFDLMKFQVIVPMKSRGDICTKNLNIELQQIFNPDMKRILSRNGYDFKVGDKIINKGNNYDDNIFNGTIGRIVEIGNDSEFGDYMDINFVGNGIIRYFGDNLGRIDMAYVLTIHSTQGSQWENVIVGFDYSAYVLLSRQLIYTAITRAEKLCILTCENDALIHAIRTNKVSKRNTFLKDMLIA